MRVEAPPVYLKIKLKMKRKTFEAPLRNLYDDEIAVYFGNTVGQIQNKTLYHNFKAKFGVISGRNGQTWAINSYVYNQNYSSPDRERIPLSFINKEIDKLYIYANKSPDLKFYVTFWGPDTLFTGYTKEEMGPLFSRPFVPENIFFDSMFNDFVE